MSFEGELKKIKDEIIENLPPEITVKKLNSRVLKLRYILKILMLKQLKVQQSLKI